MKKRIVTLFLIVIILFNNIMITPTYATEMSQMEQDMTRAMEGLYAKNTAKQFEDTGTIATGLDRTKNIKGKNVKTSDRQEEKSTALTNDQDSFIAAGLSSVLSWFVSLARLPLAFIGNDLANSTQSESSNSGNVFTIENLVYGNYPIFSINFFNLSDSSNKAIQQIKEQIAGWYYGLRIIAIMASLAILVFAAIKMVLSTVTADKVKYKKMITDWGASLLLLFVLHYFMMIAINISDTIVSLLKQVQGVTNFEVGLYNRIMLQDASGWDKLAMVLMEGVLTYTQVKFLIIYFKRVVVAAFLIMIAPIITITYPIDKINDNETVSFKNWRNEFLTLVFIQPLHALLYILIFVSASEIMLISPFLACLLIWSISKVEGILKNMFGLNKGGTIKSLRDTNSIM